MNYEKKKQIPYLIINLNHVQMVYEFKQIKNEVLYFNVLKI